MKSKFLLKEYLLKICLKNQNEYLNDFNACLINFKTHCVHNFLCYAISRKGKLFGANQIKNQVMI